MATGEITKDADLSEFGLYICTPLDGDDQRFWSSIPGIPDLSDDRTFATVSDVTRRATGKDLALFITAEALVVALESAP